MQGVQSGCLLLGGRQPETRQVQNLLTMYFLIWLVEIFKYNVRLINS